MINQFICLNCGKEFSVYPSRAKKGQVKTCSAKCKNEYTKKKETEKRHLIKCDYCNKEFMRYDCRNTGEKKNFCSSKCMGKAKENKVTLICEYCHKNFKVKVSTNNSMKPRFCSIQCRLDNSKTEEFRQKKLNQRLFYSSYKWKKLAKEVKQNLNYTCQLCGKKTKRIHAHHIIPRENGGTDTLNNLTVVCAICHGKLDAMYKKAIDERWED